ncbi:hypothetical protein A6E15_03385 [Natrinema saccharevitans]|uniref:Uncharacterized protein n=1 Tax=Natrinema saccharevitans TaxID=301967 RepID=A0A1S8AT64_9EURY|nr:hypothetical protein [Natrinema saccharevitans]OLZ40078.1 hypothetical protein A6E15_03385 [Natrinema saccharevitans]
MATGRRRRDIVGALGITCVLPVSLGVPFALGAAGTDDAGTAAADSIAPVAGASGPPADSSTDAEPTADEDPFPMAVVGASVALVTIRLVLVVLARSRTDGA